MILKKFYNLFLHTTSLLMYELNTVNFLTNLVVDIVLKLMLYRISQKVKKNSHIVLVCFRKKNNVRFVYILFLHTNSLLMYELNSVNI